MCRLGMHDLYGTLSEFYTQTSGHHIKLPPGAQCMGRSLAVVMHDVAVATLLARFTFRLSERVRSPPPGSQPGPVRKPCDLNTSLELIDSS